MTQAWPPKSPPVSAHVFYSLQLDDGRRVTIDGIDTLKPKLFEWGRLAITNGALHMLADYFGSGNIPFLARHLNGDWGDLDAEDAEQNKLALDPDDPQRLFSLYHLGNGEKIYIITEWDRSVTTILLPIEY